MKKFLLILFAIIIFSPVTFAEVFKAKTLDSIFTENPPKTVRLEALSDMDLGDINILSGSLVEGEFIDLIPPQPWGKNATFSVKLTSYTDSQGISHKINNHTIKYRQKMKPNWERQSFSFMVSTNGGKTESGIEVSPYDFKLMKESTSFWDYLWKDMTKDSMWQKGWELKYKPNETIYFNY